MRTKIMKIIVSLLLLTLLSIETFAAIVSDNDGSAFITKAEYDSLKNDFQGRINTFNSNIDNTIDDAILGYIAGANNARKIAISSLIDKDGVYGDKMKMSWSSDTNFRMREDVWPKCVQRNKLLVAMGILQYDPTTYKVLNTSSFEGGIYDWGLMDGEGNYVTNNDYGTYKIYRVETVKIKDVKYRMLRFVKVVDYFEINQFFGFPNNLGSASHGGTLAYNTANVLDLNIQNMTQQRLLRGQQVDYHRYDAPMTNRFDYFGNMMSNVSVLKTGNAMITQEYTEEKEHVYAPFSNIQEYVWDPDSDETLHYEDQFQVDEIYASGGLWWTGDTGTISTSILTNPCKHWHPRKLYFGWQYLPFKDGEKNEDGNDVYAKDSIIYNYYEIDNRNRAQKNGLVLGTTPNKNNAEITCVCSSDVAGTVYFYVGDTPIDNWTSSDFKGKKYTLTVDGKEVTCSLGKCKNDTTIWVLFKPNSTSENGKLKVENLYYLSD